MDEVVVAEGSAHYDGECRYRIRIVKTEMRPGSGDYEDPPDVRDDRYGEFYEVRFGEDSPGQGSIGSAFDTLEEAKSYAEGNCVDVQWSAIEGSL